MAFTVSRRTPLAPEVAWSALTDLAEHTRDVPLTDVQVPAGGLVLGAEVVAWTRLGPLAAADRMLVTALEPGPAAAPGQDRTAPARMGRHHRRRRPRAPRTAPSSTGPRSSGCPGLRRLDPSRRGPRGRRALRPGRRRRARPGGRRREDAAAVPPGASVTWAVGLALLAVVVGAARGCSPGPGPRRSAAGPATSPRRRRAGRRAAAAGDPRRRRFDPSCAATGWTRSTRCVDALEGRIAAHDSAIAALRGEPTPAGLAHDAHGVRRATHARPAPDSAGGAAEPGRSPDGGGRAAPSTGSGSRP